MKLLEKSRSSLCLCAVTASFLMVATGNAQEAEQAPAAVQQDEQLKLDIDTPNAAQAYSGGSASLQLEEVLVTARKKEESLQDTPVAVSALTETALKEAGIFNTRDLQQNVPGLSFAEGGSKNPAVFIRGIGQKEINATLDPGVGVYINGIFIARTDGQLLDTVDTQSIQVLRGPQGTLFGKNNTGGAILVTTIAPSFDGFLGNASVRVGNYGRLDGKLSLNTPITDSIAIRTSLASTKLDGYLKNEYDGKDYADQERLAATSRLLWEITDSDTLDLFLYGSKQQERGAPFTCLLANPGGNIASLIYPNWPGVNVDYPGTGLGAFGEQCRISEALAKDHKVWFNGPSVMEMTNTIFAITYKHLFANEVEFKSITSWARQEDILVEDDQDATPIGALSNGSVSFRNMLEQDGRDPGDERRTQVSQEFQFQGYGFEQKLSYTVGAFFALEEILDNPFAQAVGPNTFGAQVVNPESLRSLIGDTLVDGLIAGGLDPYTDGLVVSVPVFLGTKSDFRNQTYAAFAQLSYDFNDEWQLTVGVRQTLERKRRKAAIYAVDVSELANRLNSITYLDSNGLPYGDVSDPASNPLIGPFITALFAGYALDVSQGYGVDRAYENLTALFNDSPAIPLHDPDVIKKEDTWKEFTPSITIKYNMSEDLLYELDIFDSFMTYFTISEGFKAGGFEPRGTELVAFEPETVLNKELGFKLDAWDSRLRVNGAIYEMDYDNIQQRVAEQGTRISDLYLYVSNVSEATISGFELELTALLSENISLFANYNLSDAEYEEFIARADRIEGLVGVTGTVDRSNEPFVQIPETTWNVGVNFDFLTDIGQFTLRLSTYYQDEIFIGIDAFAKDYAEPYLDDYQIYNARLTYMPSEAIIITGFVDNITDENYFQGGFSVPALMGTAAPTLGPPRMYGVELQVYF